MGEYFWQHILLHNITRDGPVLRKGSLELRHRGKWSPTSTVWRQRSAPVDQ